jgi:CheY-like chemotaxis protein
LNKQPKILIVDDEPYNVDYLEQELEDLDYATISAGNGQEALEKVQTESPDLILLDIMMPVMDEFAVLARLKADEVTRDIPVIIISASSDMASVVQGIQAGAEDYLPKPFDETLLFARLKACLEKKQYRDQELEYLRNVAQLTEAAAAVQAGTFSAEQLAEAAQRTDALGHLAHVFQNMAQEIYAREQELQRNSLAREQELQAQLDRMQSDLAASETTPGKVFESIPPFDFLNALEKDWLAARVQGDFDQLLLLLDGRIAITDENGSTTHVQAPAYLNERLVFLKHKAHHTFVSATDVRCFALHGEDVRSLVASNAMFRHAFATALRTKHHIFRGYEAFTNLLFTQAEEGRLHLDDLIDAYRGLHSVLHHGSASKELDLDALAYIMPRLPGNITSVQTLYLAEELPSMFQEADEHFDLSARRAKKRKFYEILSNKVLVLLRDPMTDAVDLVTKMCIYGVETAKLRERLIQSNAMTTLARIAIQASDTIEQRAFIQTLPFSPEELERLTKIFGEALPLRLYELSAQAGQISIYFQKSGHQYSTTELDRWVAQVRKGVTELLNAADIGNEVRVHIISSNTHSVHNCLSAWLHCHADAIKQWAVHAEHWANDMEVPADQLYHAARAWLAEHPGKAQERLQADLASGILRLVDESRTGIEVSLIDVNRLHGPLDPSLSWQGLSQRTLIVNIDYAYGQQAELIMRSLILLFGKRIRSISVFGKSGAVVGGRGDVLLPYQLLMQTDDQLYPVVNQDMRPADFLAIGCNRPVHSGTLLTVLGTAMQSGEMLLYYRNFYDAIGMEMEGSFYLREIHRALSLGLLRKEVQMRFAYYTSDTPLEEQESLASNMTPAQGVPAVYAITRVVLRRIFALEE